jgi:copper homeostasis protein
MIVEACVENFSEALLAYNKGANRLELCENLHIGGTTPSYGAIKACTNKLPIPSLIMIRPRGGNFVYNQNELAVMVDDIAVCKQLKPAGVVFGCLTKDNKLDYTAMEYLIKQCGSMQVVIHKAYDKIKEPWLQIQKLKDIGVCTILSSGGGKTWQEGKENLLKTLEYCNKYGLTLTVAGKITENNLSEAMKEIPSNAFHGQEILGNLKIQE